MSRLPKRWNRSRLTVLGAVIALTGGGMAAANLAGAASGISAIDYAQCDNGPPGSTPTTHCPAGAWINGILNANNSHYNEDDVTPQRLTVQFPKSGSHTITLKYLDRKGGIHAYDYLAAADATMTDAINDRCQGLPGSACPGGPASTASVIPAYTADTTAVLPDNGPQGTGLAKDHMANLMDPANDNPKLKLSLFGGTFSDGQGSNPAPIVVNGHDNACLGCGDDYATVTLSFTTSAPNTVQLLFGGHLAEGFNADGWGEGLGAGSVSGGPYHIKWAAADGVSVGNRDNQIMSNAIGIIAQGTTLGSTATPSGDTVITDTSLQGVYDQADLEVADPSFPPTGNAIFTLYGPFSAAPTLASDCATALAGPFTVNGVVSGVNQWVQDSSDPTIFHLAMPASDYVDLTGASLAADQYYQWTVSYDPNGDAHNKASVSDCTNFEERIHTTKASPGGTSSQTIYDTVTMTGGADPSGSVSFFAYSSLADCTADAGNDGTAATGYVFESLDRTIDSSTGDAVSEEFTPDSGDGGPDFWWRAYYNGDSNNLAGDVEPCGTETFSIANGS